VPAPAIPTTRCTTPRSANALHRADRSADQKSSDPIDAGIDAASTCHRRSRRLQHCVIIDAPSPAPSTKPTAFPRLRRLRCKAARVFAAGP